MLTKEQQQRRIADAIAYTAQSFNNAEEAISWLYAGDTDEDFMRMAQSVMESDVYVELTELAQAYLQEHPSRSETLYIQPLPVEECFQCPECGKKSYHPADIENGYCGYCHDFTGDFQTLYKKRAAKDPWYTRALDWMIELID